MVWMISGDTLFSLLILTHFLKLLMILTRNFEVSLCSMFGKRMREGQVKLTLLSLTFID